MSIFFKDYKGAKVSVLRDARRGDAGFDPQEASCLCEMSDGSLKVIPKVFLKNSTNQSWPNTGDNTPDHWR